MRKIVYLLLFPLIFSATAMHAQSFTMQKDTVTALVNSFSEGYNYINNASANTITVNWRLISHTMPNSWVDYGKFGLCDNVTCYDTGVLKQGTLVVTDTIPATKKCLFKLQMDCSSTMIPAGGPYYIRAEISEGTTIDTVTFVVQKFGTSVQKLGNTTAKEDVNLYPNPAFGEVNVTFDKEDNIKLIAIYNLVGKQVAAYRNASSTSAKLDIEKIPAGIYFVRLMDGSGRVVATRRFTHQ